MSDARIAPVISLAGARAARRRGVEHDASPSSLSVSPELTVIESQRPTADELRALEQQVRQIESGSADERGSTSTLPIGGDRAARRAENVSMHALTRRGQSRAEVAQLLARRELPPEVVDAELDRLAGVGLIDDHALARELVERLRTRKKLGPSAVRAELQRRRLDRDAIDAALAGLVDDDSDDPLVDELARDRARRLGGLDRVTAERRLIDYLARKGHSGSRAREAARRALDSAGLGPGGRRPVEFQ